MDGVALREGAGFLEDRKLDERAGLFDGRALREGVADLVAGFLEGVALRVAGFGVARRADERRELLLDRGFDADEDRGFVVERLRCVDLGLLLPRRVELDRLRCVDRGLLRDRLAEDDDRGLLLDRFADELDRAFDFEDFGLPPASTFPGGTASSENAASNTTDKRAILLDLDMTSPPGLDVPDKIAFKRELSPFVNNTGGEMPIQADNSISMPRFRCGESPPGVTTTVGLQYAVLLRPQDGLSRVGLAASMPVRSCCRGSTKCRSNRREVALTQSQLPFSDPCLPSLGGLSAEEFRERVECFPPTRFQGSKRRLAADIVLNLAYLEYETVLDAFGGTGCVGYAFLCAGKRVTYNDVLRYNCEAARALLENDDVHLDPAEAARLGDEPAPPNARDFIARTFAGIYFTDEENAWLDRAVARISAMEGVHERALAWYAVGQAALAKRPYNLFHRRNLYMRTAEVTRSFGNKVTWERSFADHTRSAVEAANRAVRNTAGSARVSCADALTLEPSCDLVYLDPPYVSRSGVGVNYHQFYHFLEGMLDYENWHERIDYRSKHRRLQPQPDPWASASTIGEMFERTFQHFADSIVVVSYRSDGLPTVDELVTMLKRVKPYVEVDASPHQYALSTRRDTKQVLLVGRD
jgi:adenine-specific DNA-methyltransferase